VIHLKRHAGDLADLTPDEGLEFWDIVKRVETALRSAFDATLFNWSCYMNHAFRNAAPNPHIHWWAVPRYNHPVEIGGLVFEDPHFGSPYDHSRWLDVSAEVRSYIAGRIREGLS
jgi:diadenosine tetraphosphate (Ap4A) HIT family hydrolase